MLSTSTRENHPKKFISRVLQRQYTKLMFSLQMSSMKQALFLFIASGEYTVKANQKLSVLTMAQLTTNSHKTSDKTQKKLARDRKQP
jgi:hypothetical protein